MAAPPQDLSEAPWSLKAEAITSCPLERRDLAAAWLLLSSNREALPFADWASLLWPDPAPHQLAASWLWLQSGQLWFVERQGIVSARPLHDLRQRRRILRRTQLDTEAQDRWHALLRRREPLKRDHDDPLQSREIGLLQRWAGGDTDEPLPQTLQNALKQAHCALEPAAIRQLLVDLGLWDAHALPALRLSPWAQGFTDEQEQQAAQLLACNAQEQPGDAQRIDRTGLHCITIDDDDTEDIDDALGLQTNADGTQRIWIHVADPGRLIEPNSPLDLEARRRGSSLYLARGIEPLFPWELSTKALSLVSGQRCAAWSLWVELDDQGSVAHYGIERTWIKPAYRLSYGDADELIELAPPQEAALLALHRLMLLRRQWRLRRGALLLDQPEGRIQVCGSDMTLKVTEPSPARLMIAEAMILAGAVVAQHGASLAVALPYRSQSASPQPPAAELQQLPPGPVRHAAMKAGLNRGLTSTSPAAHYSLGLDAYVQATSPIRRYGDLLVQRQLASLWHGLAPLEPATMQELLSGIEDPIRQGIQISRDDQRHWRQVWFAQHRSGQWRADFLRWLRESDRLGLIWIDELAMELPAHCPPGCEPGEPLLVKVHRVDPLQDCLQLRAHR